MSETRVGRPLPVGNRRPSTTTIVESVGPAECLELLGITPAESVSVLVIAAGADRPQHPTGIRTAAFTAAIVAYSASPS